MAMVLENQGLVMQSQNKYLKIIDHYEQCFKKFGETNQGVDWPNFSDLEKRFRVMLDIAKYQTPKNEKIKLLDLGCGFGLLLNFIKKNNSLAKSLIYSGIDLSKLMIESAQKRWPEEKFSVHDIIQNSLPNNSYDYVVMNGLLTEKLELSFDEMFEYTKKLIKSAFNSCRVGIAFNVMNNHVDWQRTDLFHLSFDDLAKFLTKECSRNYLIRSDYGLYEYTVYLFKSPNE